MTDFPDFMIDTETTGTDPYHTNMVQLAGVAFNIETGEVCPNLFCVSLREIETRFWDEGARKFWSGRQDLLRRIQSEAISPSIAMNKFFDWVVSNPSSSERRFWAKPVNFDFPFVENYLRMAGLMSPFHFRTAIDMRSWLRGKLGVMSLEPVVAFENSIPFEGVAHDARFDTLHQVRVVLKARELTQC